MDIDMDMNVVHKTTKSEEDIAEVMIQGEKADLITAMVPKRGKRTKSTPRKVKRLSQQGEKAENSYDMARYIPEEGGGSESPLTVVEYTPQKKGRDESTSGVVGYSSQTRKKAKKPRRMVRCNTQEKTVQQQLGFSSKGSLQSAGFGSSYRAAAIRSRRISIYDKDFDGDSNLKKNNIQQSNMEVLDLMAADLIEEVEEEEEDCMEDVKEIELMEEEEEGHFMEEDEDGQLMEEDKNLDSTEKEDKNSQQRIAVTGNKSTVGTQKCAFDVMIEEASTNARMTVLKHFSDDFDLFGKRIAFHLKKMPLERALICEEAMLSILNRERMRQLSCDVSGEKPHF